MSGTLQMTFDNANLEFPEATYDYMEDPTVLKVTIVNMFFISSYIILPFIHPGLTYSFAMIFRCIHASL